jgi:hypothetical protein
MLRSIKWYKQFVERWIARKCTVSICLRHAFQEEGTKAAMFYIFGILQFEWQHGYVHYYLNGSRQPALCRREEEQDRHPLLSRI